MSEIRTTASCAEEPLLWPSFEWARCAAIFLLSLIAYWPALGGTFIWNDLDYVTKPELRTLEGLKRIWIDVGATEQYYPLLHSAFWVQHKIWGDSHVGYHVANVLLHATAACLLAVLIRRLRLPGGWLAAALFALHPVNVESVAWISEQKNTLSTVFYLWAAIAYFEFADTRKPANWWHGLLIFAIAVLCKSVTATLVPALLVIIWWRDGRIDWRRDVVPLLPWFVVGSGVALFTGWVEFKVIGANGRDFALGPLERVLVSGRAAWFYLGNAIWPANLTFIYPRWEVDAAQAWQWVYPLLALALIAACWLIRQRTRVPLAVVLLFGGTLFPTLGFFNIYAFVFSYVADHWQYLANLVPVATVAAMWGQRSWRSHRLLQLVTAGTLLSVFFALTWQQAKLYTDIETFYRLTLRKNPRSWMGHNNLGLLLAEQGKLEEAISHYKSALAIKPDNVLARANLGTVLAKIPESRAAGIAELREAVRQEPNFSMAHANLAEALAKDPTGIPEALASYSRALEINPSNLEALNNLGNLLAGLPGRKGEAFAVFERAIQINPYFAGAHFNYANHLAAESGREADALEHFRAAIKIDPNYYDAQLNMANLLARWPGRESEAISHFRKAIRIRPQSPGPLSNLGVWYAMRGREAEAIPLFEAALKIAPDDQAARQNLELAREALAAKRTP